MIIDDDPLHCEIAKSFFEKKGAAQIFVANDGIQAVAKLGSSSDTFDLLMIDLNMPEFDGIEVIRYLRDINCKVPLLIVSGTEKSVFDAAEALAKMYGLTLIGALEKPLNYDLLESMLPPCQ